MAFNCGILGLPNVGKSTLFNALTATQTAESENYPFCTIEPNIGRVSLRDERLEIISKISKSEKTVFNQLEFVDIAGLVQGASKGEGLGNKFLSNLNSVDAIIHVVRCFENKNITHVNNKVDPLKDIEIIETELLLSDLSKIEKIIENYISKNKGKKKDENLMDLYELIQENLSNGIFLNKINFSKDEKNKLLIHNFLTIKPFLFVGNVDEESIKNGNDHSTAIANYAREKNNECLFISASIESEIAQLSNKQEKLEFMESMNIDNLGLDKLISKGYELLNLINFFTSGPKESRAWSCKRGSKAPQAGAKIHTDFEKGFIKAEIINYEDFVNYNGEQGCKENGKVRLEGKDYEVNDADIITFKFNV